MKRLLLLSTALLILFAAALLAQAVAAAPTGSTVDRAGADQPETSCSATSDPCAGWGTYKVSCTGSGTCMAAPSSVTCDGNTTFCPKPCAANGICYKPCGSVDPDCVIHPPTCVDGARCVTNEDCGSGVCVDVEVPWRVCICF